MTFIYPKASKPALKDVSFTVQKKSRVALVGFNRTGKITLIKLLLQLYDPTEGRILLDGHDLREYDISSLRAYFGCVFQDFVLFAATIEENVLCRELGEAETETVRKVLSLSGFKKRLSEMEKGIDTLITEELEKDGIN